MGFLRKGNRMVNTFPFVHTFFPVNENLERFPHVGNIVSIKACFWGSRNFCNRWTLVMCRVDSNWTSEGLGDIKVNEISKKINWSEQNKLVNKNGNLKELWLVWIFYRNKIDEKLKYFWSTLKRKNIEWNWQVIILQNIETQTFKYTLFILC